MNVIRFRWKEPERHRNRCAIGFANPDALADWLRRELFWEAEALGCSDDAVVFVEYEGEDIWVVAEMSDDVFEVFAPKVT